MRQKLLILLPITLAASSVMAQITANVDTFGRSKIQTVASPTTASSWENGVNTFSGTPDSGVNTWGQLVQFDTTSSATAFNAATEFTLDLSGMPSGQTYSFRVHVGNVNMKTAGGISIAQSTLIDGTTLGTGQTATTVSVSGSTALNSLLSGNDFSTNPYVYFGFISDVSGASASASWNGTLTAVPEPSTYALLAGVMTLGLVMLRRRRKQA